MEVKKKASKRPKQNLCSEIVKRGPSFLESGEWTDCKFVVGAEPHQVVVGGYKLAMALASPVFQAMFYGDMAEKRDPIPIVDIKPDIFKTMLQYLYTDDLNIGSWREAFELYYAANKYMLDQLKEHCSSYLRTNMNVGSVCRIYEHSLLFEDKGLMEACVKMFRGSTKELLKNSSFTAADINTVTMIFSQDELDIDSELDLIEATIRYAEAQNAQNIESDTNVQDVKNIECSAKAKKKGRPTRTTKSSVAIDNTSEHREQTSGPSHPALDTVDMKKIRSAVNNIRFLTLTPQQYAESSARYLLTLPEDRAVLMNIASKNSDVPMPIGLSTSRVYRVSNVSFRYTIQNVYNPSTEYSPAYPFRNLQWKIKTIGTTDWNTGMQSFNCYLICNHESALSDWSCGASVAELRIISHMPDVEPLKLKAHKDYHLFQQQQKEKHIANLSYETYSQYKKNTSITLEVHITVKSSNNI